MRRPENSRYFGLGAPSGSGDDQDVRETFATPSDIKMFEGYGATEEDLKRGHLEPKLTDDPKYDVANYRDRWTAPRQSNLEGGNDVQVKSDWEFRSQDVESHGFLTRPNCSTER